MTSSPITSWQIDGETMETVRDFILEAPKSLQMVIAAIKLKDACSLETLTSVTMCELLPGSPPVVLHTR